MQLCNNRRFLFDLENVDVNLVFKLDDLFLVLDDLFVSVDQHEGVAVHLLKQGTLVVQQQLVLRHLAQHFLLYSFHFCIRNVPLL